MSTIQVINVRKAELRKRGFNDIIEWKKNSCLYIGRNMTHYVPGTEGSKWANPFKVQKYGIERCLQLYEEHIRNTPELWNSLDELLQYKEIGCWCKPEPCHGDVW